MLKLIACVGPDKDLWDRFKCFILQHSLQHLSSSLDFCDHPSFFIYPVKHVKNISKYNFKLFSPISCSVAMTHIINILIVLKGNIQNN